MKIEWNQIGPRIYFSFKPNEDDIAFTQQNKKLQLPQLAKQTCYFEMPEKWKKESVHPDLLATAVIFMIDPFTKDTIELPMGVSPGVHDFFLERRKKKLLPIDPNLQTRKTFEKIRPGLCFSGGVDSTAAAILMPKDSVLVFADRDMSIPRPRSAYNKSASIYACSEMKKNGHHVLQIPTDFEYIRNPIGFATNYSSSVPILLLADHLQLTSVAFGMIMESAFAIGDHPFKVSGSLWTKLLQVAGLPASLITSGLSEVGTSLLLHKNEAYKHIPQSCVRGEVNKPCQRCMKCFRKKLLETSLQGTALDSINIDPQLRIKRIRTEMIKQPIHHENIYVYIYQNYSGNHKAHRLLKDKIGAQERNVDWLAKWYEGSLIYVAPQDQDFVKNSISRFFQTMNEKDVMELQAWDPYTITRGFQGLRYKYLNWIFARYCWNLKKKPLKQLMDRNSKDDLLVK